MRVLVVKMSSLGDVIHTLPALTDAAAAIADVQFDWVVEEAFAEVPAWHPAVDRVIAVGLRRWRKRPLRALAGSEWRRFRAALRQRRYDQVIDAQGLIKSAFITRLTRGPRAGLDRASAREPWASLAYRQRLHVPKGEHAITRVRRLFAQALGYPVPGGEPDYGLDRSGFATEAGAKPYVVFLHGTTWPTKLWPQAYWSELARRVTAAGLEVRLPQGNAEERQRAQDIAEGADGVTMLPRLGLTELAGQLAGARAVVAVDTGLAHMAAALDVPCVALYGATEPGLTGTWGRNQQHLQAEFPCAPCLSRHCHHGAEGDVWPGCYSTVAPDRVWSVLEPVLSRGES